MAFGLLDCFTTRWLRKVLSGLLHELCEDLSIASILELLSLTEFDKGIHSIQSSPPIDNVCLLVGLIRRLKCPSRVRSGCWIALLPVGFVKSYLACFTCFVKSYLSVPIASWGVKYPINSLSSFNRYYFCPVIVNGIRSIQSSPFVDNVVFLLV